MKRAFAKPPTTCAEQVALLQQRGMIVDDVAEAEFYLQHLNYYRLAAYWLPFEADHGTHVLFGGTVLKPSKMSPPVTQIHPQALSLFKDIAMVELLHLPEARSKADLHHSLLARLKDSCANAPLSKRLLATAQTAAKITMTRPIPSFPRRRKSDRGECKARMARSA